ncbi:MAG: RNA polymerase sigma factor [Alphaproteobacteria bacterium]
MLTEGDIAALENEIPGLRRFARARVGNPDLADDLVQDCLERAIKKFDQYQRGTNLRAWLFTILRNLQISHYRKMSRRPEDTLIEDAEADTSVAASQEISIEFWEMQQRFEKLSEADQEVLMLVAVQGMKYDEAASILGVPIGTVRSRLSRARTKLKELYETPAATETESAPHLKLVSSRGN